MSDYYGVKPALRWSFSQWETYNQCPAKWNFQSRLKLPRKPPGPAASRGLVIHDSVESYIKGEIEESDLNPAVHRKFIPILDEFKLHPNGDIYTEKKLAFDAEWNVVPTTSPFAACIAVLDAARFTKPHAEDKGVLYIGEWKSGKPKDTHADQRSLYCMFGMKVWNADHVETTTYYLEDTGPPQRTTLASESGFLKLKEKWSQRIDTMIRDQMCAPRPGFYCRFCDFAKVAGGPCQF